MYRLSKTLIEVCCLKSHASRSFFLVFFVTCVSYLTPTCEAVLSVRKLNRKIKMKQRKHTVVIKKFA